MSSSELPEIVKRAMVHTICDTGQLSKAETYTLNKYVRKGWLSKGRGGPFPKLKTVYAHPGFDFAADREREVSAIMAVYETEKRLKASGYFDVTSENYGKPLTSNQHHERKGGGSDQNERRTVSTTGRRVR